MTLTGKIQTNRRIYLLSFIVALAVVLHRVDALIPLPNPWIKLGLANVMTLITLIFFGFRDALMVTLLRVFLGSIVGGTFLSPTFFLSLFGTIAAVFTMSWVYCRGEGLFSLIGVSVCASYMHTLSTVVCIYFFWIKQSFFFNLLPVFFTFSLFTGVFTGIIGNFIMKQLVERQIAFK
ncbi:MAG: Gx transporter family protein [Nitrospina sp.]|nr:Gx transporter family protein [Nitrospina sp.]